MQNGVYSSRHPFNLKIGGAKPRCFGSVEFNIDEVNIADNHQDRYLTWDAHTDTVHKDNDLKMWINSCCESAENSLIQLDQLQTLIEEIKPPENGKCPERNY